MKQITLDDAGKAKLKAAVGADVNVDNLIVFKADALTSAPVRKKHPVYLGAVHSRSFLEQMAAEVNKESRPVQIMHHGANDDQLPIGRVYSGQVLSGIGPGGTDALEVLFWIDKKHQDKVDLVNNGTVDQVSVAILGKEALSNKTGFDFMGPACDFFENFVEGKDDKGNIMGQNGAHVILNNLDEWFEMSLVGRGGATGARIKGAGAEQKLHLHLSNKDVPLQTLLLLTGDEPDPTPPKPGPKPTDPKEELAMTAQELADAIASHAGKTAVAEAALNAEKVRATDLQTQLTAAQSELAALKGTDQAKQVTDLTAANADLTTKLSAATELSAKVGGAILAAGGKPTEVLKTVPAEALTQVTEAIAVIRAGNGGGGSQQHARGVDFGNGDAGYVNGGRPNSPFARAPGAR
jgi:hypothetical protein